jgi:hypothetical protein
MSTTTNTLGDIIAHIVELGINTENDAAARAEVVVEIVRGIIVMGRVIGHKNGRLATLDAVTAERDTLRAEVGRLRAAAAPSQEDDDAKVDGNPWIPLDGHSFPNVSPDADIIVRHRDGTGYKYRADSVTYRHSDSGYDVLAWRRA